MDYPDSPDLYENKFTDGDPVAGIPASIASANHMNAVYDELINAIQFTGITPEVGTLDQLQQALEYYRNASNLNAGTVPLERLPINLASAASILLGESNSEYVTPKGLVDAGVLADYVGSVHWFASQLPPAGFIKANGAELLIESYPALYAKLGTTFGGDGIATFHVPDLRGEFIRGWDDGRGVDVDRELGSWQRGSAFLGDGDGHNILIPNLNNSGHAEVLGFEPDSPPYPGEIRARYSINGDAVVSVSGMRSLGSAQNSTDFARSRPRNVALIAYIKY